MKEYINAVQNKRISLNELYLKGSDEINVGSRFFNIVRAEYTHFKLFELQCFGFSDIYYFNKENIKRTNQLIRILNKHLIGVKKIKFEGNYEKPIMEIFFDEFNCLESDLDCDMGVATVELKPNNKIIIKDPHYLF